MKYVKASPGVDGKTTRLTLEMSPEEAQALVELFESGQLAEFGISKMVPEKAQQSTRRGVWSKREEGKSLADCTQYPDRS